jgi:putative membrane protein
MSFIKKYLRFFLINYLALWLIAKYISGVVFIGGNKTMAITALVLTLVGLLIKPLINLLLLPINLLTLGSFRWLVNVITLWLVTIIIPQFTINSFYFAGFTYRGFIFPPMLLVVFWVYILTAFIISLITTISLWLISNK